MTSGIGGRTSKPVQPPLPRDWFSSEFSGAIIAIVSLLALALPAKAGTLTDDNLAHQWPQGENVCSGFWIYHPHAKFRPACRDRSHGYLYPIEKHEVFAFEASGRGTRSCGFVTGNQSVFQDKPEGRGLAALRSVWTDVDLTSIRGEPGGKHDGFEWVRCFVTVWNTPPFNLKVSDACPIVQDPSQYDSTRLLSGASRPLLEPLMMPEPDSPHIKTATSAYDSEKGFEHWYDIQGRARIVQCTTGDDLPVDTHEQQLIKLRSEVETLSCPARLFRFGRRRVGSDQCTVNWNDEINRDDLQALAVLRTLVYTAFYLCQLRSRYSSSFDPQALQSADRCIGIAKVRLPQIITVFRLAFPHIHERSELPDFLSLLINME